MDEKEKGIEELKKRFFVDEETVESNVVELGNSYTSLIGVVSKEGIPFIKPGVISKFPRKEIIKAQATGRAIASRLDEKIPAEINIREFVEWNEHDIPEKQVIARVTDLVKEGFLIRVSRGLFKGRLYQVNLWLKDAERRLKYE